MNAGKLVARQADMTRMKILKGGQTQYMGGEKEALNIGIIPENAV